MKAVLSRLFPTPVSKPASHGTSRQSKPGLFLLMGLIGGVILMATLVLADGGGPIFAVGLLGALALILMALAHLIRQGLTRARATLAAWSR